MRKGLFSLLNKIYSNDKQTHLAILLVILAFLLNFISGLYVEKVGISNPPDLILSHIPSIDLGFIYVWLFLAVLGVFVIYSLFFETENFSYFVCVLSLYFIIRAGFVVLTHLRIPSDAISLDHAPFYYNWFVFSNKMFFSTQTGLPFLGFLLFKNKLVKRFMFASSIILSICALLMHQHYSIDVAAAFFITYGIYKLGGQIFHYAK